MTTVQCDTTHELSNELGQSSIGRNVIFISHANPEDNEFTKWLSSKLANAGYSVWSDVTKLIGGEKFWKDITIEIEKNTICFLFVSTFLSNKKAGTLKELQLAYETESKHKLEKFIIPLKLDKLDFKDTHKHIRDRNFVIFEENWAEGLSSLLKLFDEMKIPKSELANPNAVKNWYLSSLDGSRKAFRANDNYSSNWFKMKLPDSIYIYEFIGNFGIQDVFKNKLRYPYVNFDKFIITFVPENEVKIHLSSSSTINFYKVDTIDIIKGGYQDINLSILDANNKIVEIIKQAWNDKAKNLNLCNFEDAHKMQSWYFKKNDAIENVSMELDNGKKIRRKLVGNMKRCIKRKEKKEIKISNWHYAVSATPKFNPFHHFVLKHHVIFTDDGETPWEDSNRMHIARRKFCKNWWNDKWHHLLLIYCHLFSEKKEEISVPVSDNLSIIVNSKPSTYSSAMNYIEEIDITENDRIEKLSDEVTIDVDDEHSHDNGLEDWEFDHETAE